MSRIRFSMNAAKILRRLGPTARKGRSNPGSSMSPHLIMVRPRIALRRQSSRNLHRACRGRNPLPRILVGPRLAGRLADVNDRHYVSTDTIVDDVRIPPEPKGVSANL